MRKAKNKFIHVRVDEDLVQALEYLQEDRGRLTVEVNAAVRRWYESNKDLLRLRFRFRAIAKKMDGFAYEYKVPHSVFVEWDQTWTVAEELNITAMSSDKEIEDAIREQEDSHGDYYAEDINTYIENLNQPEQNQPKKE